MATKNKTDYIFALGYGRDDMGWCAAVTPRDHFQKTGYMYDQHLPVDVRGWSDIMEGFYEPEEQDADPMKLYNGLMAQGFEWSEDLTAFLETSDMEFTVHFRPGMIFVPPALDPDGLLNPPVVSAHAGVSFRIGNVCVKAPSSIVGLVKIDAAACKKAITEMVKTNPGLIAKEFCEPTPAEVALYDADASLEKNWKRYSKEKDYCNPKLSRRTFNCDPFDDQLRAYVKDDGKQIVSIEIDGE